MANQAAVARRSVPRSTELERCCRPTGSAQRAPTRVSALVAFLCAACVAANFGQSSALVDHYAALGVDRDATTRDIKRAYRRRAKESHPDKNPGQDPAQAAQAFRQVAEAYEVLSDASSRENHNYELKYGHAAEEVNFGNFGFNSHQFYHFFRRQQYRGPQFAHGRLNLHAQKIQAAQARCLNVRSLEHLKILALDEHGALEKHVLLAVFPGDLDKVVDLEMAFPFPFAGMGSNKIWWEDIMQTGRIRYGRDDERKVWQLLEHFGLRKDANNAMDFHSSPTFVFLAKGSKLQDAKTLKTRDQQKLETWVWECLQVQVTFKNEHRHPVQMWWVHGSDAKKKGEPIAPGSTWQHTTMLSHEWWAIDTRTKDELRKGMLTKRSSVVTWRVLTPNTKQTFVIKHKACMDSDSNCEWWATHPHGECERNPSFMRKTCPLSCEACETQKEEL